MLILLLELIFNLYLSKINYYWKLLSIGVILLWLGIKRLLIEVWNNKMCLAIVIISIIINVIVLLENILGKESIFWFEIIAVGDIVLVKKFVLDIYYYVLEKMNI